MRILIYILFLTGILSCKKLVCPEPVTRTDTTKVIVPPTVNTPQGDSSVSRYTIVLQPGTEGKDASLSSTFASTNFATRSYIHARAWTIDGVLNIEKGIIQFDYSAIPAGAVITNATVTFFADTTVNTGSIGHSQLSGSNDWTLKRVTQSWDESTVTWNTQPSTDPGHVIKCAASTSASQAYTLDVTSWVMDEIAHPTVYYGFLMEINNNAYYRAINFYSSDGMYPALHPKMVIEYTK